ncbi:DUF202 domain-containing protein [Rubrivirga sp. IMCC45206]|uniref:DUF202 domain-containing protein n=1 Tax=Rubrivirga sp. IMCC45206 TaxID=3391614 RepID=UPI00398FF172
MPPDATLRDDLAAQRTALALDRTALANERTLLAYARTALALLAGGLALLQFVDDAWGVIMGTAALPLAAVVGAIGVGRYARVRRRLRRMAG